jgi:uncharacterized protein (DUF2141 family)
MKIICMLFLFAFSSLGQMESGEIKLIINHTKTDSGIIRILIFNQAEGFPGEPKKALEVLSIPIKNSSAQTTIRGLPPGNYAVSVFHDEDEDGIFKKNSVGLPLSSYGFSNNPALYFGPPSFLRCKVVVNNKPVLIEIILR